MSYNSTVLGLNPNYYFTFNGGNLAHSGSASLVLGSNLFDYGNITYNSPSVFDDQGPDNSAYIDLVTAADGGFVVTDTTSIFDDKTFSISGWLKAEQLSTNRTIFEATGSGATRVSIYLNTSGSLVCDYVASSGTTRNISASDAFGRRLDLSVWHHFVYTVTAGTPRLYINGTLSASAASNSGTIHIDASAKNFGRKSNGDVNQRWNGSLDELAVFNTALSDAQVLEQYRAGMETYPYEYSVLKVFPQYYYAEPTTANSHPVDNLGSAADGTTSGSYNVVTGFTGTNAFAFDRSTYTGFKQNNQQSSVFQGRTWYADAWIKVDNTITDYPTIFRVNGTTTDFVIFRVRGSNLGGSSGFLEIYVGGVALYSTVTVNNGQWRHVAVSVLYSGTNGNTGTVKLYVDGVERGSISTLGMVDITNESSRALNIGYAGDGQANNEVFVGSIDNLRLHDLSMPNVFPAEYTRFGLYNEIPPFTNAGYNAEVSTASGLFVDPSVSVTSDILELADPSTASAEFALPGITVETNTSQSATPQEASAESVMPSIFTDSNVNHLADPQTASAHFVDSVTTTTATVSEAWLTAYVTAELPEPALITNSNLAAGPMEATGEGVDVNVQTTGNFDHITDHFHITNAELVLPTISVQSNSDNIADPQEASLELVLPTVFGDALFDSDPMTSNALFVDPVISVSSNISNTAGILEITVAEMTVPVITVELNALILPDPIEFSMEFRDIAGLTTATDVTNSADTMTAEIRLATAILVQGNPANNTNTIYKQVFDKYSVDQSGNGSSNRFYEPEYSIFATPTGYTSDRQIIGTDNSTLLVNAWGESPLNTSRFYDYGFINQTGSGSTLGESFAWDYYGTTGMWALIQGRRYTGVLLNEPDVKGMKARLQTAEMLISTSQENVTLLYGRAVTRGSGTTNAPYNADKCSLYLENGYLTFEYKWGAYAGVGAGSTKTTLNGTGMYISDNTPKHISISINHANNQEIIKAIVVKQDGTISTQTLTTPINSAGNAPPIHMPLFRTFGGAYTTTYDSPSQRYSYVPAGQSKLDVSGDLFKGKVAFVHLRNDMNLLFVGSTPFDGIAADGATTALSTLASRDSAGASVGAGGVIEFTNENDFIAPINKPITHLLGLAAQNERYDNVINGQVLSWVPEEVDIDSMEASALSVEPASANGNVKNILRLWFYSPESYVDGNYAGSIEYKGWTNSRAQSLDGTVWRIDLSQPDAEAQYNAINDTWGLPLSFGEFKNQNIGTDERPIYNENFVQFNGVSPDTDRYITDTYNVFVNYTQINPTLTYNLDDLEIYGYEQDSNAYLPQGTTSSWSGNMINLRNLPNYNRYSTIVFMDYPDSRISEPQRTYLSSAEHATLISRLKQAVVEDGKNLYVSSAQLAKDLGIVDDFVEVSQNIALGDAESASVDPFEILDATEYTNTHRNNRYKIVTTIENLTDKPTFIMTDAIAAPKDFYEEYHLKYENRPDGLKTNDEFFIPGLPLLNSQLTQDQAGYLNNRKMTKDLDVFPISNIRNAKALAVLSESPDFATTLVMQSNDILDGQRITGKIFVNTVEDAHTLGQSAYNKAVRQIVSLGDENENEGTILYDYSTARTTREYTPIANSVDQSGWNGQTVPTFGGGGPIIQASTNSSDGTIRTNTDIDDPTHWGSIYFSQESEIYPTEVIDVLSLTYLGIEWLQTPALEGLNLPVDDMRMTAEMRQNVSVTTNSNVAINVTSMYAGFAVSDPDQVVPTSATNRPLPMFAEATMRGSGLGQIQKAAPMTANATMTVGYDLKFANATGVIRLNIYEPELITLYIQEESN